MSWLAHPTQIAGVAAFTLAALASLLAASVFAGRDRRFLAVAIVNALYAVEVANGWRFALLIRLRQLFARVAPYDDRTVMQVPLVLLVLLLALVAVRLLVVGRRGLRGGTVSANAAALATAGATGQFLLELVSWHPVDHILYHPVGPLLLGAWLWIGWGLVVMVAALFSLRPVRQKNSRGEG